MSLMNQKDIRGYFLEAVGNGYQYDLTQIYLIDYGICLKPGAKFHKSYSCGDRRSNEVYYSDFDMDRSKPLGALDFLEEVQDSAQNWVDENDPWMIDPLVTPEPSWWTFSKDGDYVITATISITQVTQYIKTLGYSKLIKAT
ncbi:hypothetical protein CTAM01_13448 [Colletotrichum tamarilloi]|uniref:Uncharacterized protein n=1 Tax=Colletotrichum tamarilloi TaxID=1209934 RepID=A0ABQ9QS12_9PEZI|nr:uncharacterized protein CTAM01_13448 [Colletotrichum tamarilloi]KAK1483371.1 hypothetical protein CTAM01_13448 [Colletotrichum tamarilloi]